MKQFGNFLIEGQINPLTYNLPKLYKELNALLFANELPSDVQISFKKLPKRIAGLTVAKRLGKGSWGQLIPGSLEIFIDPREFTEEVLKGIVAHEMIHAYLMNKNDFKTNHDGAFLVKLAKVKALAKFDIPISHTTSADEFAQAEEKETVALVIQDPDGKLRVGIYSLSSFASGLEAAKLFAKGHVTGPFGPHIARLQYGRLKSKLHIVMPVQRAFNIDKIKLYTVKDLKFLEKFDIILDVKDGK